MNNMKETVKPVVLWWGLDSLGSWKFGSFLGFERRGCTWAQTPTRFNEMTCTISTQYLQNNGLDHVCLVNKNVKSMSYNWIIDATLIHRNKTIKYQIVTSNDQSYVLIEAF